MTTEEIRVELQIIVPSLLAEIRNRRLTQRAADDASTSWQKMTVIVSYLARQVLGSSSFKHIDTDEVSQRVMLKLQSEATLLRVGRSAQPPAYLRGLIRFAVLDLARALEKSTVSLEDVGDIAASTGPDPQGSLRRSEPPAEPVEGSATVQSFRRLLRNLRTADRRLLEMRFWSNLSVAEIARALGEPPSRVSVRLFRLIERLKKAGDIR
jgi:RNA polymerase sigma factor (sigma-70 family)